MVGTGSTDVTVGSIDGSIVTSTSGSIVGSVDTFGCSPPGIVVLPSSLPGFISPSITSAFEVTALTSPVTTSPDAFLLPISGKW